MLRRSRKELTLSSLPSVWQVDIDLVSRQVKPGQLVHLTPIEYRLLCVLLAHAGKVMTHRQLAPRSLGPSHSESNHYLRIYVGHLRQSSNTIPPSLATS